ncbi:zinc-ribbon domain-containing protein [Paenibacillus validus]|uniref:zinc-ribbon domain-containing protein n=2 Tax=Paenibacillus TaxID=44249 RepID=UPI00399D19A7
MAVSFCSHCNEKLQEGSLVCKYCGALANEAAEASRPHSDDTTTSRKGRYVYILLIAIVILVLLFFLYS